ncbi:MAG: hypothetical protein V4773_13895 [Verrucomicrobiota bacterium]
MDATQITATGTQIATTVATYIGLKEMMPKLLGPSFDYLGGEAKGYTEKGINNLKKIFIKAANNLGDPRLETPGQVSPKVLKEILNEGYFCEDELGAEYYGGVLASSRTSNARDDRGASFIKLVSRLSTYQLRAHHVIFTVMRTRNLGFLGNAYEEQVRSNDLKTAIGGDDFARALDLNGTENFTAMLAHVLGGLCRESLILNRYAWGSIEDLTTRYGVTVNQPSFFACPAPLGFELFLWANGLPDGEFANVFERDLTFKRFPEVAYPD